MKSATARCMVGVALAALAGLPGCATYDTYRKCGLHGCAADAPVTAQVRALLAQHPALGPPNRVYVQTLAGVVYLSGQVQTDLQREDVETLAAAAAPGHRIIDSISVSYSGR